jgi:acid phosphatase
MTQPYAPGTALGRRLPLLTSDNIGDNMTNAGVSWGWYSGGWANAAGMNGSDANHPLSKGWNAGTTNTTSGTCTNGNIAAGAAFPYCPDALFQYHHQAFGYFAKYADGTPGRAAHLKDELDLFNEPDAASPANTGRYTMHSALPKVAFIKPIGQENEHPGYAGVETGESHLVKLLQALLGPTNRDAKSTMVVVTYDEFGGQYDHVSPPGTAGNTLPHDAFGPGTRIPAIVVSRTLPSSGVDHTSHDTVSIIATIEKRFGVSPIIPELGSTIIQLRDQTVAPLNTAYPKRLRSAQSQ